jgi:hypothetical protein
MPGDGVMPVLPVSVGVVRALLLGAVVDVPVFAVPVVVVAGAGTQSGRAEGVVVVVVPVVVLGLVAEAGGVMGCGVAGATLPAPGAFVVSGTWVVDPGAIPGLWLGVVVFEPGLCANASPVLSSRVEMNKGVRVMKALSSKDLFS